MSKIIKIIDERDTKKHKKEKEKKNKVEGSYNERVTDKSFGWAFKLGFIQVICKTCLIFKSDLELFWSTVLKERELYESKHVAMECRCLKIWDLLSFLICSSILVLIWRKVSPT